MGCMLFCRKSITVQRLGYVVNATQITVRQARKHGKRHQIYWLKLEKKKIFNNF